MKKTYMTPALEIFRIETEPLLAGSPTIGIVSDPNIADPNDVLAPELPGIPDLLGIPGMNIPGTDLPK